MRRNDLIFALITVLVFVSIGTGLSLLSGDFIMSKETLQIRSGTQLPANPAPHPSDTGCPVVYNPPSLKDAPSPIRDAVTLGYNIMTHTDEYAAPYVGNKLDCDDCHFKGGLTGGGRNGGLSLVGVGAVYPKYKKRRNYPVDLVARTNACFRRSLNGKALPPGSREMTALVVYYQWISKGIPVYADIPWLGLSPVKSSHRPDGEQGKQIFSQQCAACHGSAGQGTEVAPPLWGGHSFNDGAGMSRPETFSSFVYLNMPKGNPDLTEEQALDTAAFVTTRPRPHFAGE